MPHISIEISPALSAGVDWNTLLPGLHQALAEPGWAALDDLKSRVHLIAHELCGAAPAPASQQLIATLTLTNPRPPQVCRQMAETLLCHLSQAIAAQAPGRWVQCCVFLHEVPKGNYLKQQWNLSAPMAQP